MSAIPPGWTIKRVDQKPFKRIELTYEHGRGMRYTAIVDSLSRNPENMLYMLAEDLLNASGVSVPRHQASPLEGTDGSHA